MSAPLLCPKSIHRKLRLFTSSEFLPPGRFHNWLLQAFWGTKADQDAVTCKRFANYFPRAHELFAIGDVESPDAFLFPGQWDPAGGNHKIHELARLAKSAHKPLIVFYDGDAEEPISVDNALVFRTSMRASRKLPNEIAMPAWTVDILGEYADGRLRLRRKSAIPSVAYSGYVDYFDLLSLAVNIARRAKNIVRPSFTLKGGRLRGRAVRLLQRSPHIDTRFRLRRGLTPANSVIYETRRRQFADNIIDADYALTTRGNGNFSYRLYEIMSCGRIPVLINTDCVLPFDDVLDWRRLCVWVEADDLPHLPDRVLEFHNNLTTDEFLQLQLDIRHVYEEWLSPCGFYSNMHRYVVDLSSPPSER